MTNKRFTYLVYDASGAYIGVWKENEVVSELLWSQRINTPGTTTTVRLARSASKKNELRDDLTTELPELLTTEDGEPIAATYVSPNTVGSGSDVDINYSVEVYVTYGDYEGLTTQDGEQITTESGENIIVAVGAPDGTKVFSGIIVDYAATYSDRDYVDVTIASHGLELSNEVIKSGSATTVTFSATPHEDIIKSILDTNPGTMTYSSASIQRGLVPIDQVFRLSTKLEGIQTVYDQSDDGWYWYGNVRDNLVYFGNVVTSPDHSFYFKSHVNEVTVSRSMESLRNVIYFVGGDPGTGVLYKKFTDPASIAAWRQGVYRITDRTFTTDASSQRYADKVMNRYAAPIYTSTVKILSEVYDIESISLGQMVTFRNFNSFLDGLLLQIVSLDYSPRVVTLGLGELLDRQIDIVGDIADSLQSEQYVTIPSTPT